MKEMANSLLEVLDKMRCLKIMEVSLAIIKIKIEQAAIKAEMVKTNS